MIEENENQQEPEAIEPVATPEAVPVLDADAQAVADFTKGMDEEAPKAAPVEVEEPVVVQKDKPEAKTDEPDPVEDEIKSLKLKTQAAERFRELSARPTEADVAPIREMAKEAEQMRAVLSDAKATSAQLQTMFGYIKAVNSGDPKLLNQAYESMVKEAQWLAKMTGRELPGLADPLSEHADLAREVEEGDLTRKRALEIAQQRTLQAREADFTARQSSERQAKDTADQVRGQAMQNATALADKLRALDADYAKKMELLQPTLDIIEANLPPQKWVAAIEQAYMALPALPKPTVAPVGSMPLRPTGNSANQVRTPKNDVEAFQMGMAQA